MLSCRNRWKIKQVTVEMQGADEQQEEGEDEDEAEEEQDAEDDAEDAWPDPVS